MNSLYDQQELLAQFEEPVMTRRRPPLPRIQTSFSMVGEVDAFQWHGPQFATQPNEGEECHGLPQVIEAYEFDPYSGQPRVPATPSLYFDSLSSTPVNNASHVQDMHVDSLIGSVDSNVKDQFDGESYYAESEEESGSEDQLDESDESDYPDDDNDDEDDSAPPHAYTQFVLPTWQVAVPSTPPPSPHTFLQGQGQVGPPLPPSITIITPPSTAHPAAMPADQLARDNTNTTDMPCSPENTDMPGSPDAASSEDDPASPDNNASSSGSNTLDDEPLRCRLRFRNGVRCNATFITARNLARHKRISHPGRKWPAKTCVFCKYRLCFTEEDAYIKHLDRVHRLP